MELEKIRDYSQLEEILDDIEWQEFEEMVGKIFEFHDYDVTVSKVITYEKTKHQYDVIAEKGHSIIADCKKWDNRRRIKHGLKRAAKDQIDRVKRMDLKRKYPILVTSDSSPIEFYDKVPIVPVQKLNSFISHFQENKEEAICL